MVVALQFSVKTPVFVLKFGIQRSKEVSWVNNNWNGYNFDFNNIIQTQNCQEKSLKESKSQKCQGILFSKSVQLSVQVFGFMDILFDTHPYEKTPLSPKMTL